MELSGEDWARVEALLPDAQGLPPDERRRFLQRHCGGNEALRAEIESLLAAGDTASDFLVRPPAVFLPRTEVETLPAGTRLGAWRLGEPLGRGGMGDVYAAERADGQFEMPAAIKVLKRGLDTDALLRRFLRERSILARLTHPNIARLLDAGATADGRPYFVMERVRGSPITAYCRDQRLGVHEVLRLVRRVCEAVDLAHRSLIVHRDLKPSNVLVTEGGEVKLLDFGVAKVITEDEEGHTRTSMGAAMLTPSYAAPEQILGEPVSAATDVYALGAMLYELLAGRLPHRRDKLPLAVLVPSLRHETVEAPSAAARSAGQRARARELAGDLDLILLKALQPEPERRYRSAHELADDLQRYLEHRPVEARPDTLGYRVSRFLRRYPVPVAAAVAVVLALVAGLVIAVWQARLAQAELARANAVRDFLTQDVLANLNPDKRPVANFSVKDVLALAASQVDSRFADRPQVAAELHYALATAYRGLGLQQERKEQAEAAVALFEKELGRDSLPALQAREEQGYAVKHMGDYDTALAIQRDVLARRERTLGPGDPGTLMSRLEISSMLDQMGDWPSALAEGSGILDAMVRAGSPVDDRRLAQFVLADYRVEAAEVAAPEQVYRDLLSSLQQRPATRRFLVPKVRLSLALLLTYAGRYAEAEQALSAVQREVEDRFPAGHYLFDELDVAWAGLRIEQGRLAEGMRRARQVYDRRDTLHLEARSDIVSMDLLGRACLRAQHYAEAAKLYEQVNAIAARLYRDEYPVRLELRARWIDALLGSGRLSEAAQVLDSTSTRALPRLPAQHPTLAEYRRVQGLLWLAQGKRSDARAALAEALDIYQVRLGPDHWRTKRARRERDEVAGAGSTPG